MKKSLFALFALLLLGMVSATGFMSCSGRHAEVVAVDSDSIRAAEEEISIANTPLPVTPLPSAEEVTYVIETADSTCTGELSELLDRYDHSLGSFTFRGGPKRDADYGGSVKGTPTKIVKLWTFETEQDFTPTPMGTWGGGSGWTGQPVYVSWPDSMMEAFRQKSPALTADFDREEIMVGSLCEKVYFINFQTGKASRQPLDVVNPIKGSISLDPTLNGNLYVGQGIPKIRPFGQMAFNLFSHKQTYFSGQDPRAWLGWGASDSSPLAIGGYLFWPGENGSLYKYRITADGLRLHSTLRWKTKKGAGGMENSMCVYRNYGFVGNNNGDIICIDLNTLKPVWHYDNHDDIDASIVCEVVDDVPYLYSGCEVDHQGNTGISHFVKLNGLTGEAVWEQQIPCKKLNLGGKHFDGGFYSTPLLGKGDCEGMIFANVCQRNTSAKAEFTAFSTKTGEVIYRIGLDSFAWSSPVAFYNEDGKSFIFAGDSNGNAYLIEGKTGTIIYKERMVNNFESSPVVVGNQFVVGSRGNMICKFEIC